MRKVRLVGSALLLALFLVSRSPRVFPELQALAAPAAPAKAAWKSEWDRTVEAAKKEGVVVFYTVSGPSWRTMGEAFKQRFGIRCEMVPGPSNAMAQKILTERQAGLYLVDGMLDGWSTMGQTLKPAGALENLDKLLILPDLTDPKEIQKTWSEGKLHWHDKDHTLLSHSSVVGLQILVNTEMVKPGEIKGYRDLLDPKWKGRILMQDPTLGTGRGLNAFQTVVQFIGLDYWQKFVEQKPMVSRDERLVVEWVARGKYPAAIAFREGVANEFLALGSPIKMLHAQEGQFSGASGQTTAILKNAPHPNAAKLFLNWVFSKEGQTQFVRLKEDPTLRTDVSNEGINPLAIADPKKTYLRIDTEEWLSKTAEMRQKAKEIFAPLGQ